MGLPCPTSAISAATLPRSSVEEADWARIDGLYDTLVAIHPAPSHRLGQAAARWHAHGPEAALQLVRSVKADSVWRWTLEARLGAAGRFGERFAPLGVRDPFRGVTLHLPLTCFAHAIIVFT